MTSRVLKAIIAASLTVGLTAGASAASAALRYNDLDLATEAGQAELERRIDTVMRQACPEETVTGSRIAVASGRAECMADVRRQIMARVNTRSKGGSSSR